MKNQVCADIFANVAFTAPDCRSVIFTPRNFLPNIRFWKIVGCLSEVKVEKVFESESHVCDRKCWLNASEKFETHITIVLCLLLLSGFSYSMFILHAIRWGRTLKPLYPLVSCNIIFCIIGQISKKFVGCFLPETTTLNWMLSTSRLSHFFPFMCFTKWIKRQFNDMNEVTCEESVEWEISKKQLKSS